MDRVVIVSNRVMLPNLKKKESTGGLAVALKDALKQNGGIWCGWSGQSVTETPSKMNILETDQITYATMDLSVENYKRFYNGYCNEALWPVLHYRLDMVNYQRLNYDSYQNVNSLFAVKLQKLIKPTDIIWVHDYHFMPIAKKLRALKCTQNMGFFLHVPWPTKEILMALPDHRELVESLLEYDIIGFQTKSYVLAFMDYVVRELGGIVEPNGFIYALGKRTKVQHFPIAIETKDFSALAAKSDESNHVKRLVTSVGEGKLMIGVDRLDYSKGLFKRFEAYEKFLSNFPQHHGSTTLMQIAPTSRGDVTEYQEIRQNLERKAGNINGTFADFDWNPIRYLNRGFSRKILAGFYRRSSVGLVTPLRDGMNLVAKEYVAAQSELNPGVLVLSRFAGAAEEMDGALLVNPYDVDGMAKSMHIALNMSLSERITRWTQMMDQLEEFDIHRWRKDCVQAIQNIKKHSVTKNRKALHGKGSFS